ncbi:hypothetical protein BKA82DRAFT_4192814 [Pisolithus tinctorius]|nr:hypothetical protein BKA82DRAFT_4192814 [Pisolithus tinctorius]
MKTIACSTSFAILIWLTKYAIPLSVIGINPDLMKEYIQFIADDLLLLLGNNKFPHPKPHGVHHKQILPSSLPNQMKASTPDL